MNTWKPILAALVIFAAGVVTGGFTAKLANRGGERRGQGTAFQQRGMMGNRDGGGAVNPGLGQPQGQASMQSQQLPGMRRERPQDQMRALLRRMRYELNLTPEQHTRVEGIIKESQVRMQTIWDQFPAEFRTVREKIRSELTPEQRRRFEEIFRQRNEWQPQQQRQFMPGGGPGPGQGREGGGQFQPRRPMQERRQEFRAEEGRQDLRPPGQPNPNNQPAPQAPPQESTPHPPL